MHLALDVVLRNLCLVSSGVMQTGAGGKLVPKEGLVEVTPADHEYWDVFDKLRAPTHCGWGQMDDAWISSLHRVQNKNLLE